MFPTEELRHSLQRTLFESEGKLRAARFPGTLAGTLSELGRQVGEPCVLAVVGKVKAGKSSLINCLLDTDMAVVGNTETTATVNWFRYGKPDTDRPVYCVWRDGPPTSEPMSFIALLQGYSKETLELASRIDRLEFRLERELLKSVTIVDTPGLDADPDEHQDKTAEFLGVSQQLRTDLRARHHSDTQRLAQDADAVLYVFDPVVKGWEQKTLEQFQHVIQKGTTTFNSLGVLGKIDAFLEDIERAPQFVRSIEQGLGDAVNTVVPISAGLRQIAEILQREPETLDLVFSIARDVAPETMELLFANDELFLMDLPEGLPTPEQRSRIVKRMPWTVLQTVIKIMGRPGITSEQGIVELERIGGFDELRRVIQRTFAARGRLLRSYRIVCEADRKLERDTYPFISQCRELDRTDQDKRARFLLYLQRLGKSSAERDKGVITEIQEYVDASCGRLFREAEATAHIQDIRLKLSHLKRQLEVYNEDLVLLQILTEQRSLFTPNEIEELESLFGKHRLELRDRLLVADPISFARSRQEHWRLRIPLARNAEHRLVLEGSVRRYGAILFDLNRTA